MRVIQSNLVYIINLPSAVAEEEVLKSHAYFGQYGNIKKCIINKSNAYQVGNSGVSYGAYITYSTEEEAIASIKACDGFVLDGKVLTLTFGTTKYCAYFLRNTSCPKLDCLYLHKLAPHTDMLAREVMPHNKHIQPSHSIIDKLKLIVTPPDGSTALPMVRILRERALTELVGEARPLRPRIYSKDSLSSQSRFGFVQDSDEFPTEVPNIIEELMRNVSPCKEIVEIASSQMQEILSPSSPDKWAKDILRVVSVRKERNFMNKYEENIYMIAPVSPSLI